MNKRKIFKIIENVKDLIGMWLIFYLWVGVTHYMSTINLGTARFMFWGGIIFVILLLLTSPRIKKALQLEDKI